MRHRIRPFEILVMAGMIAGLGVMLTATFAANRARARGALCQTTLKRLGLGVIQYIRDYDELYPPSHRWEECITPYVSNWNTPSSLPTRIKCPDAGYSGYAMNSYMSYVQHEKIRTFSLLPLIFESHRIGKGVSGAHEMLLRQRRHPQGIGVVFADAHVEFREGPLRKDMYWRNIDRSARNKKNR